MTGSAAGSDISRQVERLEMREYGDLYDGLADTIDGLFACQLHEVQVRQAGVVRDLRWMAAALRQAGRTADKPIKVTDD